MAETPIIDAAIRAGCIGQPCSYPLCGKHFLSGRDRCVSPGAILTALRAALPWQPPPEVIEAMARVLFDHWFKGYALPQEWRDAALLAYHTQPIMCELYDENGAPR
jgi:hypothetical protein